MKKLILFLFLGLTSCVHAPYHSSYNAGRQHALNLTDAQDRAILQQENWDLIGDCMDDWHHECIKLMRP
jgi:hypothetical protein